ncbi:hypothetical protein KTN00_12155 [Acinetobacter soli]|uniref:portal protein n=1 Tax=Acinetobacter soli TaxID=487316 RepID=UPI001C44FCD8|nr:hypothetical protein [Acinetobacter soli]MBV6551768.1 hypothetical protein [Acinetobacter soli]
MSELSSLDPNFLSSPDGQFLTWASGLYYRELELQSISRTERSIDAAFYDGEQFTQEELDAYEERNQKPRVFNEIKPTVDWILGGERRARTDWAVMPRTEDDSKPSVRKNKLVKYIDDINNARWHRSEAFTDMCKTGEGWTRITYEPNAEGDNQIKLMHEHWRSMLCDSKSRKPDMTDMQYVWCTKILPIETLINYFPNKKNELIGLAEDMEDLERELQNDGMIEYLAQSHERVRTGSLDVVHSSGERDGVRVYEMWYKKNERVKILKGEGSFNNEVLDLKNSDHVALINDYGYRTVEITREQMYCALYTDTTVLYRQRSPYKHNRFPFIRRFAYLKDKDGSPYGVIRSIRDPQSDLNTRRNRALFLMASSRVIMDKGAVEDKNGLANEVARWDAIIEKETGKELRIEDGVAIAGTHLNVSEENSAYIRQISGVTGENRGMDTNATSGIAIQARQEQGTVITTVLSDMHSLARKLEGEIVLSLIEQFMDRPMQFRITADNLKDKIEFMAINDEGDPETDITRTQSDFIVAERDYRTTMRQALSEQLISVAGTISQHTGNPDLAVSMLTAAIELQDLPDKDRLIDSLRNASGMPSLSETEEERIQREQQEQQQQEQVAQQQKQLQDIELKGLVADTELKMAQVERQKAESKNIRDRAAANLVKEKLDALKTAVETGVTATQAQGILPVVDQIMNSLDQLLNIDQSQQQFSQQPTM